MADCPQCGKKVPDNMKFCGFCGIELETGRHQVNEGWLEFFQIQLAYVDNSDSNIVTLIGLLGGLLAGSYAAYMALPAWNWSAWDWYYLALRVLLLIVAGFATLTIYALVKAKARNRKYRHNRFLACQELLSGIDTSIVLSKNMLKEMKPQGGVVTFFELLKQWWHAVRKEPHERSIGREGN